MPDIECGFGDSPKGISGQDLLSTYGPTIHVDIGFDKNWKMTIPPTIPIPSIRKVRALVDTGAGESCIDDLLAVKLKLPAIDKRPVSGSAGQHEAIMYLAQIHIPEIPFTIYGSFAGLHLRKGGQPHDALIGRTFLRFFTMVYDGKTGAVKIKS